MKCNRACAYMSLHVRLIQILNYYTSISTEIEEMYCLSLLCLSGEHMELLNLTRPNSMIINFNRDLNSYQSKGRNSCQSSFLLTESI